MHELTRSRILDNSAALRLLSRVAIGSLFLEYVRKFFALIRRIEERFSAIIEGSRCAAFFKVGDYLEADSSKLVAAVRSADTYHWSSRRLCSMRDWLLACLRGRLPRNSAVNSFVEGLRNHRYVSLAPRSLIIFVLVFLGVFYALRLLLLTLFSEAEFYLTWSSGLILALLLIGLLTRFIPEESEESGKGGADGILAKTSHAIRRALKLMARRQDR